jgi:hypothetical protein
MVLVKQASVIYHRISYVMGRESRLVEILAAKGYGQTHDATFGAAAVGYEV